MSTVRKTISMPEALWEQVQRRMKELGCTELSDYAQQLMRVDTGLIAGQRNNPSGVPEALPSVTAFVKFLQSQRETAASDYGQTPTQTSAAACMNDEPLDAPPKRAGRFQRRVK